jgi:hypothetical protein
MSDGAHDDDTTARPLTMGPHYLRDGERGVVPVGVHFVPPSGPDWPWRAGVEVFERAFAQMAGLGLDSVRIDVLWSAVEPEPGRYDEAHLRALDEVLEAARRHGLRLHPVLFIGGEVGDAVWDPAWRDGRHPHADAELRRLQAEHAGMLARRWAHDPAVLAWDLTDEPPSWLFKDTDDDAARAWTAEIAGAIRDAGAIQPVTIGTASQEIDQGAFRADVVAAELDFACVHPYPIYSPELYPDALLSARMTRAGAFETALAAGAGRPVMVHEYGASSTQFAPEAIAAYDRVLAWSSLGRGAIGFYPWCWTDAEPAAYVRAPYVRMPHETQFGLTDHTGAPRPRAHVLRDLAATLRHLDLDRYAGLGPVTDAAIPVPHEYVRPYDPASYGLGDAPAGPYVPAETAWSPERDVKPLVRGWLNAFVLAARAGISAAFPRESLSGEWPAAGLLLLPAPLTTTTCSLWHVRTSFWQRAQAFLDAGGTVYLSCCADSAIPEMSDLAGCRIADRTSLRDGYVLRFVEPWGGFAPGDELPLPGARGATAGVDLDGLLTRGARLECGDARVIATLPGGEPALVVADRGAGQVVTCALPVELLLAREPDAHGPDDASWRLYAGLADLRRGRYAGARHPDLTSGELRGPDGGTLVVTNHSGASVRAALHLPGGAHGVALVGPDGSAPLAGDAIELEPWGAAVIVWDGRPAG